MTQTVLTVLHNPLHYLRLSHQFLFQPVLLFVFALTRTFSQLVAVVVVVVVVVVGQTRQPSEL